AMTTRPRQPSFLACVAAAVAIAGCTGEIGGSASRPGAGGARSGSAVGPGGPDGSGNGTGNGSGTAGANGAPGTGGAGSVTAGVERVAIHRLNNTEYDNTVRDLLGVQETPARTFIADEKALGFDNIADALGMTEAQYEQY